MSLLHLATVLHDLGGSAFIRPDSKPFATRVTERVAEVLDEVCEDIDEADFDLAIDIESAPNPRQLRLAMRATSPDFDITIKLAAHQLLPGELKAVLDQLDIQKSRLEEKSKQPQKKVIVRKKSDNSYDGHIAAQKLRISSELLRKTVPCTDYNASARGDGTKELAFRYRKDVIDTLAKLLEGTFGSADLSFIAETLCDGDLEWAKDLTASIKAATPAI